MVSSVAGRLTDHQRDVQVDAWDEACEAQEVLVDCAGFAVENVRVPVCAWARVSLVADLVDDAGYCGTDRVDVGAAEQLCETRDVDLVDASVLRVASRITDGQGCKQLGALLVIRCIPDDWVAIGVGVTTALRLRQSWVNTPALFLAAGDWGPVGAVPAAVGGDAAGGASTFVDRTLGSGASRGGDRSHEGHNHRKDG